MYAAVIAAIDNYCTRQDDGIPPCLKLCRRRSRTDETIAASRRHLNPLCGNSNSSLLIIRAEEWMHACVHMDVDIYMYVYVCMSIEDVPFSIFFTAFWHLHDLWCKCLCRSSTHRKMKLEGEMVEERERQRERERGWTFKKRGMFTRRRWLGFPCCSQYLKWLNYLYNSLFVFEAVNLISLINSSVCP